MASETPSKQLWTIHRLIPEHQFATHDQPTIEIGKVEAFYPTSMSPLERGSYMIRLQTLGYSKVDLVILIDRLVAELEIMRRQILKQDDDDPST